jgi:WD40 repeat protein
MQNEVELLLQGPQRLSGFYYDSRSKRYFPVPKQGGISWNHYQDTRLHYEKQLQEAGKAEKAKCVEIKGLNSYANLASSLSDIRIGCARSKLASNFRILKSAFFRHRPTMELEMRTDKSTRVIENPVDPETIYAGSSSHIMRCSIEDGQELSTYAHTMGQVSGLAVCPSRTHISVSYLSGSLELLTLESLERSASVPTPRNTSVWCHAWINSNSLVCGSDRGGFVYDVSAGIYKGIPMEKSSVFSIAKVSDSESTFFVGTRSGKLIHVDIRSNASRFSTSRPNITRTSGVNHMTSLKDSNYLMSRSMDGNLFLLDLRVQKDVSTWSNPSTRLSFTETFCLDNTETYIASAGAHTMIFDISAPSNDPIASFEQLEALNHFLWSEDWLRRKYSGFGAVSQEKIEIIPIPS